MRSTRYVPGKKTSEDEEGEGGDRRGKKAFTDSRRRGQNLSMIH